MVKPGSFHEFHGHRQEFAQEVHSFSEFRVPRRRLEDVIDKKTPEDKLATAEPAAEAPAKPVRKSRKWGTDSWSLVGTEVGQSFI
jgi:hypothetical protein